MGTVTVNLGAIAEKVSSLGTAAFESTSDFATAADLESIAEVADSAVQPAALSAYTPTSGLGSAAFASAGAFASAAQGAKADSALQPNTSISVSGVVATNDMNVATGLRLTANGSIGYVQAGVDKNDTAAQLNIARNHTSTTPLSALNVYAITTTFNGSIVVTTGTASDAPIAFDGPDTQYQLLRFNRGGERRWAFGIDSNAAGMFRLFHYGDDSTYLGSVLDFDRATGAASFNAPVTIGSGRKLSKITVSSAAPGTLADGELYLQY